VCFSGLPFLFWQRIAGGPHNIWAKIVIAAYVTVYFRGRKVAQTQKARKQNSRPHTLVYTDIALCRRNPADRPVRQNRQRTVEDGAPVRLFQILTLALVGAVLSLGAWAALNFGARRKIADPNILGLSPTNRN